MNSFISRSIICFRSKLRSLASLQSCSTSLQKSPVFSIKTFQITGVEIETANVIDWNRGFSQSFQRLGIDFLVAFLLQDHATANWILKEGFDKAHPYYCLPAAQNLVFSSTSELLLSVRVRNSISSPLLSDAGHERPLVGGLGADSRSGIFEIRVAGKLKDASGASPER